MFFHGFWTFVLFPENIETKYILIPPLKKIEITKVTASYIMQYQLNWSEVKGSNIIFLYKADLCLYKKDYLFQSYWAMSKLPIKFPMHLTVKLSENNFYHHKSSCKQENILKNIFLIMFLNLVCKIHSPMK